MRTFWRLLSFLRPYRAGSSPRCSLAAAAIAFTVAIPYLTGQAINAVRPGHHDRSALIAVGARDRRRGDRCA